MPSSELQEHQHEKLIRELEEERHLRLQSEERLREVTLESERNRVQMRGLQQQFSSYFCHRYSTEFSSCFAHVCV
ncbi:hypothetical protein STEG23_021842, partial [Scotinomys teguina]